ncbi:MAG TPA: Rrf2 family transcriptional regulator [Herpetosiphonaceae bacterium]
MRLSTKGEYGVRALFDLAQHYGEGLIQSREIAERQAISENYLNQLLIGLRKAGLITSVRGPQGGHQLARPPQAITLLDALLVLEGPLLPIPEGASVNTFDGELVSEVWTELRASIEAHLSDITLADLCHRKRQQLNTPMYYI